ncbi:MAG: ABC transporter permease subunit, partial [Methanothrix sp.]|nr:ABC transporter permease subunit [Methanothrix sp.]
MTKYIIRRFIGLIPTLFVIMSLSFFIIRVAPGGPFAQEKAIPKLVLENILKKYHMDEPLWKQYGRYMLDVMRGDLGPSYRYADRDVNYYMAQSLPDSMVLGLMALALALVLGIGAGILSATRQNTWADYGSMAFAIVGVSVPLFVIGPVLMFVFALKLRWFPTSGWFMADASWKTAIMPVVTLTFPYFAYIARLSRASILEVLRSDYVRTAQAKGLRPPAIMFRHIMKGALLPVVSYLGPAFANIVTGSIVVESIFRVPGLGNVFIQSAQNRDYTLIMGTVIVYSAILLA